MSKVDEILAGSIKKSKKTWRRRVSAIDKSPNSANIDKLLEEKSTDKSLTYPKIHAIIKQKYDEDIPVSKLKRRVRDLRDSKHAMEIVKTKSGILKINQHLYAAELLGTTRNVRVKLEKAFNRTYDTGESIGHHLPQLDVFGNTIMHLVREEKRLMDSFGYTKDHSQPAIIEASMRTVTGDSMQEILIRRVAEAQSLKSDESYKEEIEKKNKLREERNRIDKNEKDNQEGFDGSLY